MGKKNLYIVFDQLPGKTTGGLVTTYVRISKLLKEEYNIKILSIFNYEENELFKENEVIYINKNTVSSDCINIISYIKKLDFKQTIKALKNLFLYFVTIPYNRRKVSKLINKDDLVIVSCPSAAIFMPKNIDFILEIHIYFKYFYGSNLKGRLQSLFMQKPKLTLYRTKSDMIEAKDAGFKDVGYVYNFFENKNIKPNKKLVKNKICFVGRLEKQKDLPRMIEIASKLKQINNNFILDIYGEGSQKDTISRLIKRYHLEENVFLKGFTQDKNIYANYSIMWMTSSFEGFGLTIIEAKSNGVPTISTNWGNGVYEVINDGIDGFIVNNNEDFIDKTTILLSDDKMLEEFKQNSLHNFDKFSKERAKNIWIYILNNYKNKNIDNFFDE